MIKEKGIILSQEPIGTGIFSMWIATEIAKEAKPGQFVALYPNRGEHLLQRPISICEIREDRKALRLVYRVAGAGTGEFSGYQADDTLEIMGPLGNGYDLATAREKHCVVLMGGGIGIPPMTQLAKELNRGKQDGTLCPDLRIVSVMGYRNRELFLNEELGSVSELLIATEDGSVGTKGNVLDALRRSTVKPEAIYSCGPMPMLRAIKQYGAENGIPAYISLEERMACGVGACLGCVCRTVKKDAHSQVNNARVCVEGPVFPAEDVDI